MRRSILTSCTLACLTWTLTGSLWAASFDCSKARRPLEKFICANPELDAADTRMGEVYRQINAGFPLKGFLLATQREFLSGYPYCMNDANGRVSMGPDSVKRCVERVRSRTTELQEQALALVYSDAGEKFTHDNLAILIYSVNGSRRIRLWGNWMPDAYNPKPFPDGKLCDINDELKPVRGGFQTDFTDEVVFRISEASLTISEHIMCTPRNGIAPGSYRRVR
jgi:uncharacterized protein YecT (DUF1311 family)